MGWKENGSDICEWGTKLGGVCCRPDTDNGQVSSCKFQAHLVAFVWAACDWDFLDMNGRWSSC